MTSIVLFLMFTVLPAIELWLIIRVGEQVGAWQTVMMLVLAGVVGSWLGKRAGFQVIREIFDGLRQGIPPADKLVEAGLVLVGAVLLITPGYLSDVVGLLLFVGPVRRLLAPPIKNLAWRWLLRRGLSVGPVAAGPGAPRPAATKESAEPPHFQHPVA